MSAALQPHAISLDFPHFDDLLRLLPGDDLRPGPTEHSFIRVVSQMLVIRGVMGMCRRWGLGNIGVCHESSTFRMLGNVIGDIRDKLPWEGDRV